MMLSALKNLLFPFTEISKSLRTLVELYELDLASRTPPVIRVTEEPTKYDTEVSYAGEEDMPRSLIKDKVNALIETWTKESEDE